MKSTESKNPAERTQAMYAIVEAYLSEPGTSQRAFCARHQIALSTFYYYLAKYRQEQQNTVTSKSVGRFIPLKVADPSASSGGTFSCEVIWPDGVVVRFCTTPTPAYLLSLVERESGRQ